MSARRLGEIVQSRGVHALDGISDVDELAEIITRSTRPHAILPHTRDGGLDCHMYALALGDVSFTHLVYGGDVTVVPNGIDPHSFLVPITVQGTARLRYGGEEVPIRRDDTTLIAPYREFRSDITAEHQQVIITIPRTRLEAVASSLLTGGLEGPLMMQLETVVLSQAALRILEAAAELAGEGRPLANDRLRHQMGDVIIESLLLSMPAFLARLGGEGSTGSTTVHRAMRYMLDHLAEPMSVADVAREVGVSARALQAGFRREVDDTPGRWLRRQRLARAHDMLRAADARTSSVTQIAHACGLLHLGEFAALYKSTYGCSPAAVLRDRPETSPDGARIR